MALKQEKQLITFCSVVSLINFSLALELQLTVAKHGLLFLDLTAAFDTDEHLVLTECLKH